MKEISVVISARDEFPQIVMTVHSIIHDLETSYEPHQWEIIIVDNCSQSPDTWRFIAERGLYYHGNVKVHHDPIAGNVTARNKGAELATGKYLFFSDAHMAYRVGSFKSMVDAIEETGGMVHPAVQWMGGYDPSPPSHQYTLKIGEKLWGTWNRAVVNPTQSFYIPVSGHCCLGMKREQFLEFGGYNDWFRCYGGGELYLDLKWWMMGSTVSSVPQAVGYHLSAGRGYSYHQDDLIHNMILLGYALGADALAERVYIRYVGKKGVNMDVINRLNSDAKKEAEHDRASFLPHVKYNLYELLEKRPWDVLNEEKFGTSASYISIYDDTWTDSLTGEAKSFFKNSQLQKEFNKIVDEKLSHLVYRP